MAAHPNTTESAREEGLELVANILKIFLTEGDKIKQVGSPSQVSTHDGAKIIDLGSTTLLPGLVDGHTHLFLDIVVPPEAEIGRHQNGEFAPGLLLAIVESPSKRVLMGAQLAREDLESGITTVRNLGHSGVDGDTELRTAAEASAVPRARIEQPRGFDQRGFA